MHLWHQIRKRLAPWGTALLNVLYPRLCRVCQVPLAPDRRWFCTSCEKEFTLLEAPYCSVCAEPYDGAIERAFRCDNCADRKLAFEFAYSAHRADGAVRDLIHQFKYNRDLSLRATLGDLLLPALDEPRLATEDLSTWHVVPVPLHHTRRRERGFNQAALLARHLSRERNIPMIDALRRVRATGKQADLTRVQRLENLRHAFALKSRFSSPLSPLRGAKVLLIDDVFTTGATTDACARVLRKEAGVEKVVVIAVARG